MHLQTTRLTLREVSFVDLSAIHELLTLKETDQYNTLGIPKTIDATTQWVYEWSEEKASIDRSSYTFTIELNDDRAFVGLIAIQLGNPKYKKGTVWFKLHPHHWNKGYASEALKKLLHFAFNKLHLHRIEAGCAVENIASKKVLEKVGMIQEGLCRANLPIRGEWVDNYEFAMLETDYEKLYQPEIIVTNAKGLSA
ncbi:MAG TPA: GNAT family protein [Bacteroidia bacterium]|jgi:RimJ/RimL family protein N-acetyltransferase|nr:GNAT family protein [Bacteroidia bacterium]